MLTITHTTGATAKERLSGLHPSADSDWKQFCNLQITSVLSIPVSAFLHAALNTIATRHAAKSDAESVS